MRLSPRRLKIKQLLIISGKGGTGKTTLASAFIKLSAAKAFADCDVDAPNLHMVVDKPFAVYGKQFLGIPVHYIDPNKCLLCGLCQKHCHFEAIAFNGQCFIVDPFSCEGCGLCKAICTANAITENDRISGDLLLYRNPDSVFSTAQLRVGSGSSGLLVTEVKRQMISESLPDTELAIIDGSPGIGCPVIASISGVDIALIVTEPSMSGISDMKRIIKTCKLMHTSIAVCINKHDTDEENTEQIEMFCQQNSINVVGKIPYDSKAIEAVNQGKTIVDIDCPSGKAAKEIYKKLFY